MACSISPFASVRAFLQSIIPAPVFSRSSFTWLALIAIGLNLSYDKKGISELIRNPLLILAGLYYRRSFVGWSFDGFIIGCGLDSFCARTFARGCIVITLSVFFRCLRS